MNAWKVIRNVVLGLAGLVLVLLVALQILLRPSVLTGIVNGIAADFVEGDVSFRQVKAHVIKSFPYLHIEADQLSVTYPHERHARWEGVRGGRSPEADTLVSLDKLILSINYPDLIRGTYNIHQAELRHPRIFAHCYDSTAASWDILPLGKSDGESKPLPPIRLHRVLLTDRPFIVYSNLPDTLFGQFSMQRLSLDGEVQTWEPERIQARLELDSLRIRGRLPSDTLSLNLARLRAAARHRQFSLDADATVGLRTRNYGRLRLPVTLNAQGHVPARKDSLLEVDLESLALGLSSLKLEAKGHVTRLAEGWEVGLDASSGKAPLGELIDTFRDNFPVLRKWKTDAVLDINAHAEGIYGGGKIPSITANVMIPDAFLDHESLGRSGRVSLDAVLETDGQNRLDADVSRLLFAIAGAKIDASGDVRDILGEDPQIALDAKIRARVDSLTQVFTRERGIVGSGVIQAGLHGKVKLSQLNMASIGQADIDCSLRSDGFSLESPGDSLSGHIRRLDALLRTRGNSMDLHLAPGARVLLLRADADTLDVRYKENIYVQGSALNLQLQNGAEILGGKSGLTPLTGRLRLQELQLRDSDGLSVGLQRNAESFRIIPAAGEKSVPRLSLVSESGLVHVNKGPDSYILDSLHLDLAASERLRENRPAQRRARVLDSLRKVYPEAPQDSLLALARASRSRPSRGQNDISSADISISLSRSLTRYWRDWDFDGNVELGEGLLMMPSFPLLTSVQDLKGSLDNDKLDLKTATLRSGVSDISASATLSGLRRAVLSRGRRAPLKLKAQVESDYIDANELMRAYAFHTTYKPEGEETAVSYEALDTVRQPSKVLLLPSNLDLEFSLEGSGIKYDSLLVNWLAADVAMRQGTLQITNTVASSNMGDIYFEGFYSTRSREDIKAGFDLNLVDITAEKVITLFPAVDTIMPMLTTFAGDLDCELAATSEIDTLMNLVLPSVDGILKISGKDLSLKESEEFTKIARMLMFRNQEEARVDNMAVTGMVRDNTLEVFPFVLDVDRYLFAASGIQHLDKGFDYHISVIRSPLLVRFGLNAWGDSFDQVHYGIGRARYKNANVPVFTKQLDTVQYSLVAAIHNVFELGVEKAISENNSRQYLQSQADEIPQLEAVPAQDSLQRMAALYEDVIKRVSSRREALKEELVRLEEELAVKNKEEDDDEQ